MAYSKTAIPVPYKRDLCPGLSLGFALRVRLFVKEDACSFKIKFNCDSEGKVIALQLSPRPSEQTVVLNTKDGCWQEPEKGPGCFQFHQGHYFDIHFIASDGCFDICVNGSFFTSYKYRIALERIRYLDISGDIILMDVGVKAPLPSDHTQVLPSGPKLGDIVAVKGFFYHGGSSFTINLINGVCPSNDIALHFNPQRDNNTTVLNNQKNGCWEQDERHLLPCQWQQKALFEVEIAYTCSVFQIYINGQFFASFTTRGKVGDIRAVGVKGDAYFYNVQLLRKVDTPFVDKLPKEVALGAWICITGTPEKAAKEFGINLQSSGDLTCIRDVAFHFNPRFTENLTVRNSLTCGNWGKEDRAGPAFPFKPEHRFEVIFLRLCGVFKVFVNRKFYIDYAHRIDPSCVKHVRFTGDCDFHKPERC